MGRTRMKSPSFGLGKVSGKVRVRSKQSQVDPALDFISGNDDSNQFDQSGRRIMVVIDSSEEAKCALQWTLSHTVLSQDTIVLLYVAKCLKPGKKTSRRIYELLQSMKKMCLSKRPEVQVEIALVAGKEKGPTIVQEVKKQGGSLLVLGRKKRSMMWRAVMMWRRNRSSGGIVEYCIENANCMTVGVRRKRNMGGYLITTKKHKDFWLLA